MTLVFGDRDWMGGGGIGVDGGSGEDGVSEEKEQILYPLMQRWQARTPGELMHFFFSRRHWRQAIFYLELLRNNGFIVENKN